MRKAYSRNITHRFIVLSVCLTAFAPVLALAAKTDIVILKNGDRITGEIKKLERGLLSYSTDAMGTINIEWDEIAALESKQRLQFETEQGTFVFGSLAAQTEAGKLSVRFRERLTTVDQEEVIRITPIEDKLLKRLKGDVSFGFSFTQASQVSQLNFAASVNYRTRKFLWDFSVSSIITTQEDRSDSKNNNIGIRHSRFLQNRWFSDTYLSFQQNDELGIEFRTLLGGGAGRYLFRTNTRFLALSTGLVVNNEVPTGAESETTSLEALGRLDYAIFQYDDPKTTLGLTLDIFPSITESGRVRAHLDNYFRRKFLGDFYWELQFYASYDNRPPDQQASTTDYGIITSLGYEL